MRWSRSLFWTFTGTFLVVVAATTVLLTAVPRGSAFDGPFSTVFFLLAALLVAGGGGYFLFRTLNVRLRQLERWATRVEQGDLATRVPGPADDEIGRLGTGLHRMATRLAKARARLKSADQERRRLLADISHELATPLTSIRASAETLLDADVPTTDEERRQILEDLLGEAQRMDLLIKDLFDLTRLESNTVRLVREHLDWAALCHHTVTRYKARFNDAGLELRTLGTTAPAWVNADGRRLEQVLENLLANALRYGTAPGTVTVALERLPDPPRHLLEVADDGPGIPEVDLARIFDRFYRSNRDRSAPGSGLGLAIVKEFVERHGGRVEAGNRDPEQGTGAVLRVELPEHLPTKHDA